MSLLCVSASALMTGLAHKPRSRAGVAANGAYRKRVFDALDAHLADRVSARARLEYESPAVFQSGDRADGSVASSATLRATAPGRTWHSHCIKGVAANLLCRSVEVTTGAINDFVDVAGECHCVYEAAAGPLTDGRQTTRGERPMRSGRSSPDDATL